MSDCCLRNKVWNEDVKNKRQHTACGTLSTPSCGRKAGSILNSHPVKASPGGLEPQMSQGQTLSPAHPTCSEADNSFSKCANPRFITWVFQGRVENPSEGDSGFYADKRPGRCSWKSSREESGCVAIMPL